jgi:hypothetical protein
MPQQQSAPDTDRDCNMKKLALTFVACMAVSTFAPAAGAMTLGALTRTSPVAAVELVAVTEPAICRDVTCGLRDRQASSVAPVIHVIFASFSQFVGKAGHQLIAAASNG